MDTQERQRRYKEAVEVAAPTAVHRRTHDAYGFSNSAKIVEGGLFAFNVNFENLAGDVDQVVVNCLLSFPPEDQVYFSLVVKSDMVIFADRLDEMRAAGSSKKSATPDQAEAAEAEVSASPDTLAYAGTNNNVKGYIAEDGKLYLRNKGFWDRLPDDLSTVSKTVVIDQVLFSIYPPAASARRSVLARQFVGYLGTLIGADKIHELQPWPDPSVVDADMRRMPATIALAKIEQTISELGGFYPGAEVRRFHVGLNFLERKHFVILSGLSGTGKTLLPLMYARAVHGLPDMEAPDPFLSVCPVRPEWTDPTGLTGYYDVLSNRYIVPPFLEAVMLATAHADSPVFVVLDEMNLARVEYYFSDVLSCIETGENLQLHSSSVPLEGSTGTSIPAELALPPNLYLTGTINIDETTSTVSDKVLDRAVVIDMSDVDIGNYLADLETGDPKLKDACAATGSRLVAVQERMAQHGLGFGYRVAEEVVRYQAFVQDHVDGASADETLDDLMVQKVLVKLRGAEKQRGLLTGLLEELAGLPRSTEFLNRLVHDLDEFGSFQAGR